MAQLHDVAVTLSDVLSWRLLWNAADWFAYLPHKHFAVRAAVTGCTSGKRLRLVDGTAISAPGAAALNGDYIWDMILIPVSSLILS